MCIYKKFKIKKYMSNIYISNEVEYLPQDNIQPINDFN